MTMSSSRFASSASNVSPHPPYHTHTQTHTNIHAHTASLSSLTDCLRWRSSGLHLIQGGPQLLLTSPIHRTSGIWGTRLQSACLCGGEGCSVHVSELMVAVIFDPLPYQLMKHTGHFIHQTSTDYKYGHAMVGTNM